jgi:transposase
VSYSWSYSWFPVKEPLIVPYEPSSGRRVNVMGAYFSHGSLAGRFVYESRGKLPECKAKKPRKTLAERAAQNGMTEAEVGVLDSEFFLAFVWRLAGKPEGAKPEWKRERPLVIVLDNYSVHTSHDVKDTLPQLNAANVELFYLPSYSPELSKMEPIWRDVKYHELSRRSFVQLGSLKRDVDDALQHKAKRLSSYSQSPHLLDRTT